MRRQRRPLADDVLDIAVAVTLGLLIVMVVDYALRLAS